RLTDRIVRHLADAYLLTISFSRSCVRTSPHCQSSQDSPVFSEKTLKPPTSKCPSPWRLNSGKSTMLMFCVSGLSSFFGQTHEVCAATLCRHVMTLAKSSFKSSEGENAFLKTPMKLDNAFAYQTK